MGAAGPPKVSRVKKPLYAGLIGQKFMGRAHSNAWRQVAQFFDLPRTPVMHTVAGRDAAELSEFARNWGWKGTTTRWHSGNAPESLGRFANILDEFAREKGATWEGSTYFSDGHVIHAPVGSFGALKALGSVFLQHPSQ